jgi:hypothetical protein
MSYITEKLKLSINKIKNNKFDDLVELKTKDIMKYFDILFVNKKFKKYGELKENKDYFITKKQENKFTSPPNGFASSSEILKILNSKITCNFLFEDKKIKIIFYHNDKDDNSTLNDNINKIVTRIYNLLVLYKNKKYKVNSEIISLLDFKFVFYLYSNPRRSDINKSGKEYLEEIAENPKKCFNVYSGQTMTDNKTIYTSRLEECVGLLTHEVLHGAGLIYMPYESESSCDKKFNIFEMFTNAFASTIHAYLYSYETDTNIKENLKLELYHAILHSARLSINTNITIFDVIQDENNARWTQNALLYEYINGRLLILLFFDLIFSDKKTKEITNNLLSLDEGWEILNKKYSDDSKYIINNLHNMKYLESNNQLYVLDIIKDIHSKFNEIIKQNKNKGEILIQQYFLFDPIEIEKKNVILTLCGGKINYKKKYFEILEKIFSL